MTKKTATPLLALAESLAEPKQVKKKLQKIADAVRAHALKHRYQTKALRERLRWALDGYLDNHYYANFKRKQTIDKIISKTMRGYEGELRSATLALLHKERSSKWPKQAAIERLKKQLTSGQLGESWSYSWHYASELRDFFSKLKISL